MVVVSVPAAMAGLPVGIVAAALDALCAYHWPGNVRELRNWSSW